MEAEPSATYDTSVLEPIDQPEEDDSNDDSDGYTWLDRTLDDVSPDEQQCANSVPNADSMQAAHELATQLQPSHLPSALTLASGSSLTYEDTNIRSQVLSNSWHLMDQFKISKHHSLYPAFF